MRAVALLLSFAVSAGACFPNNPKAQTYAKVTEGGLVVAGIAMLFAVNTGADCDMMAKPGMPADSCHTRATVVGDIGLGLILAGLIGFIATVSGAEDEKPATASKTAPAQPTTDEAPKTETPKTETPAEPPKTEPTPPAAPSAPATPPTNG